MYLKAEKVKIKSRSTGFWSAIKFVHAIQEYQTFAGQWKRVTLLACLACIVYNWEVNSHDDNKRLVMEKINAVVVTSLHEKLFDPQAIRTSWVVEFTGPNKNKNNFTCLLLYQFAAILSQKYQAFPAVVAFNQVLPIFYFLF